MFLLFLRLKVLVYFKFYQKNVVIIILHLVVLLMSNNKMLSHLEHEQQYFKDTIVML